ncbi:hypothetical protein [Kutzneria buriramensis]|uniref:Lincosamide nucleotidyltransferase n=1 Tax=Kutzneria buriramensis TaxID=1045776 RepID=A0A3E0HZH6_9PSEU|nr:hypothetical protein [Kutzneria buriramensis]REH51873.1 lincosamide nucleotidyltransferase [Kutzneria buriramensis]
MQEELIARVRAACLADEGLDAALMYGSFAADEADEHSDVEFWLFFTPARRAEVDPARWCGTIAPISHGLVNEFGTYVVFFPGLIRGEFHFATTADIAAVAEWPARGAAVDRMVVVDRRGALAPVLAALPQRYEPVEGPEAVARYCDPFVNWLVLAHHLTSRGELLRAWDALGHVQRHLVWMARLAHGATEHWLTPSRRAEWELPPEIVRALRASTTSAEDVRRALPAAFELGRRCWTVLADRYEVELPTRLLDEVAAALRVATTSPIDSTEPISNSQ